MTKSTGRLTPIAFRIRGAGDAGPYPETPEIKGRWSYAVALHEIGHLLGPYQRPRYKCMMNEIGAWKWARRNALICSLGMQRMAQKQLDWYASVAPQHGITDAELEGRKWTARQAMIEAPQAFEAVEEGDRLASEAGFLAGE